LLTFRSKGEREPFRDTILLALSLKRRVRGSPRHHTACFSLKRRARGSPRLHTACISLKVSSTRHHTACFFAQKASERLSETPFSLSFAKRRMGGSLRYHAACVCETPSEKAGASARHQLAAVPASDYFCLSVLWPVRAQWPSVSAFPPATNHSTPRLFVPGCFLLDRDPKDQRAVLQPFSAGPTNLLGYVNAWD